MGTFVRCIYYYYYNKEIRNRDVATVTFAAPQCLRNRHYFSMKILCLVHAILIEFNDKNTGCVKSKRYFLLIVLCRSGR